jgi:type II secretory pathway component PulF
MRFKYEAMDRTGQEVSAVIEAESEEEAMAEIRRMGFFVTKIKDADLIEARKEKEEPITIKYLLKILFGATK